MTNATTNEEIYRKRTEDILCVLGEINWRLSAIAKGARKGDFPLGEYGDALKHLVFAARNLGGGDNFLKLIAKRNNIEY